ncbi:hypothetical protein JOD54_006620 [Actinokineospora baliensis]|uniref:hypothetical protein n=1 Tax=Actinokineospora baliensis TaxID=547056 RepID=UPI00195AF1DC|nr:hypothetical protein [Actinokineospora baliensis]MBM7776416.1 hypothetical protein [Actinokineospora baliensis]
MRTRALVTVLVATLVAAGCAGSDGPAPLALTKVDLPGAPVTLTPSGTGLLIGLHRDGQPVVPALVRRDESGAVTEIPTTTATPYGKLARWTQIAVEGDRLFAVGGERGGAHGNVRWSVWDGGSGGLTEKRQAFSTFGGYGAGDLVGVVTTPAGPVVLGGWDNPNGGFDVATWLPSGDDWIRQPSAGTALEASRDALPFPIAATALADGILIVGWQFADGREQPVTWRSKSGNTGWTKIPLPTPPTARGAAMSVSCTGTDCVAAGRLDGSLALWRLTADTWTQLPDVPTFPVSDTDVLPAPVLAADGSVIQLIGTPDGLKALRRTATTWTTHPTTTPGKPTAATTVGTTLYTVVDDALWTLDLTKLH